MAQPAYSSEKAAGDLQKSLATIYRYERKIKLMSNGPFQIIRYYNQVNSNYSIAQML
jgi:hypothetical protein